MPLIHGKSKKAFGENVKREMDAGKPQPQALAIAYSVKRKAPKKMAQGGEVLSAKHEKRPMPDDTYNDSAEAGRNRGNKAPHDDSWTDNPTIKQAQRPSITKLSQPRIVGSDAFSVRNRDMRDEENNLEDSMHPQSDKAQPIQRDNEEGPKRQGPKVSDMEAQHNNKRAPYDMAVEHEYAQDEAEDDMKKYAKGGSVESMEESDEKDMLSSMRPDGNHSEQPKSSYDESHDYGMSSGNPDEAHPHTGESEADMLRRHAMELAHFANGGNVDLEQSEMQPEEDGDSMVREIMKHRKMKMADGGEVDLEKNSEEDLNNEDQMSFKAGMKEQYDLSQLSKQPKDSNEKGDSREDEAENEHDASEVSQIRKKMKSKRS